MTRDELTGAKRLIEQAIMQHMPSAAVACHFLLSKAGAK